MTIWKRPISLALLQAMNGENAVTHLGIEYVGFGDDYLIGRVPVDKRTIQPYGLIHGGVNVLLAETLGSVAANFAAPADQQWVGLDINANHLRGVSSGWVTGTCRPVHIGKTTQVWHIDMRDDAGELSCVSRITMAVLRSRAHLSPVDPHPPI